MIFPPLLRILTSLKLTVGCLLLAIVLVFVGTLAQVDMGFYAVQEAYFNTWLIWWKSADGRWVIPIFPGGYLIGGALLLNLIAAQAVRFHWNWKKSGIFLTHTGIFLLLVGGFLTSLLTVESQMRLDEGETKNYSEAPRLFELVLVDASHPGHDEVIAVSQGRLSRASVIQHPRLPFRLNVLRFFANSKLSRRPSDAAAPPSKATQGFGVDLDVVEQPRATKTEETDLVSALVEIVADEKSLGTWLISNGLDQLQSFSHQNKTWRIGIRPVRYYKPFRIQLLDFKHDLYPGTEIPRNFSSHVRLVDPAGNEDREVLIYMNHPLRHAGETYYQASFANDDRTTILQVMRNPTWLTPYFACALVTLGLLVQFLMHLISFRRERNA